MNLKKIFVLILALTLVFALASCKKDKKNDKDDTPTCTAHVDANDDLHCDSCGADFDDGKEAVVPTTKTVTIVVELDGAPLEGVKLTISNKSKSLDITTDANGKATLTLELGNYAIDCDYTTLPEYCAINDYGIIVDENTSTKTISVINNKPDGTKNKPFPVLEETTYLEIPAGAEVFFTYRGSSVKHLTINNSDLVVNYNGNDYPAIDGVIFLTITPDKEHVGSSTYFSVKNISSVTVSSTMELISPLGSNDNPYITADDEILTTINGNEVYYKWTADASGILFASTDSKQSQLSITKNITKTIDGEEIVVPIIAQTNDDAVAYMQVEEGDELLLCVSYPDTTDEVTVKTNLTICPATDSNPLTVVGNEVTITLNAGSSIVIEAIKDKVFALSDDNSVSVSHNNESYSTDGNNKISFTMQNGVVVITNSSDDVNSITFTMK